MFNFAYSWVILILAWNYQLMVIRHGNVYYLPILWKYEKRKWRISGADSQPSMENGHCNSSSIFGQKVGFLFIVVSVFQFYKYHCFRTLVLKKCSVDHDDRILEILKLHIFFLIQSPQFMCKLRHSIEYHIEIREPSIIKK